jgi:hypothetical protein
MGNLKDQLKKIKDALGLGRDHKKTSVPETKKNPLTRSADRATKVGPQFQVNRNEALQPPTKNLEKSSGSTLAANAPKTDRQSDIAPIPSVASSSNSVSTSRAGQLRLPSFMALSRTSEFKAPDAWVARGVLSQLSTKSSSRRNDVFIGLDFGTAFTKAAVQILDNIYPVDWDGVAKLKEKYLLPTEYSETTNNYCYLGQSPDVRPDGLQSNLKRGFITQHVLDVDLSKAIVFVALVLQYVRSWIYHHHAEKLGSAQIGWYFNIGIPSDVLDQDKHAQQYKKVAEIAWTLSLRPQSEITFENATQALSQPVRHEEDLRDICAIPELVAQLAGYSKSARRQNGLHTLIDIGGGTVDMVTFNVHQADGDDVFPFFVSKVKPLGSFALLENRLLKFDNKNEKINTELQNLFSSDSFAKAFSCNVSAVEAVDKGFFKNFQKDFEGILDTTFRRRYPSSPNWLLGMRTFISGGGAFIPGYIDSIRNSQRPEKCPLLTMDLPPHPKLIGDHQTFGNYNRISVACGLAVDAFSLGAIRPASEVEDATPLIYTVDGIPVRGGVGRSLPVRERLDRDELYPK